MAADPDGVLYSPERLADWLDEVGISPVDTSWAGLLEAFRAAGGVDVFHEGLLGWEEVYAEARREADEGALVGSPYSHGTPIP